MLIHKLFQPIVRAHKMRLRTGSKQSVNGGGGKLVLVPILLMVRKETLNATKSINLLT